MQESDQTAIRNAVLIVDGHRESEFRRRLEEEGVSVRKMSFTDGDWNGFDFSDVDLLICWPNFQYSSNHPQALRYVKDNLLLIHRRYPHLRMFPDPGLIPYYGDKYLQHLFLEREGFPVPRTMALEKPEDAERAFDLLGSPVVVKNRYGAGGDYVFKIERPQALRNLIDVSQMRFGSWAGRKFLASRIFRRKFVRGLLAGRPAEFPFLSPPLLAQKFVPHTRDIKTVVGLSEVVEAHWRERPDGKSWKVNIDGGGLGIWSYVPDNVIELSVELAGRLNVNWLNIDCLFDGDEPLISEFSPVWHHYKKNEHENLVYKDDYNLRLPLDTALDLELLVVTSFTDPGRLFR